MAEVPTSSAVVVRQVSDNSCSAKQGRCGGTGTFRALFLLTQMLLPSPSWAQVGGAVVMILWGMKWWIDAHGGGERKLLGWSQVRALRQARSS